MKIALPLVAGLATAAVAQAQVLVVSENFNTLASSPAGAVSPSPFSGTTGVQAGVPNIGNSNIAWQATRASGTGTTALPFTVDTGSGASGSIYSYGAAGNSERALGSVASGTNVPAFGVAIVNTSSEIITSFTVAFTQENWRSSTTTQNVLAFAWGVSGGAATASNFLTEASLTALTDGDLVGPAPVTTNGALDGNLAANQRSVSFTVTPATPIPAGATIFLRWTDANDVGNDAGLAIDNFTFTAVPAPGTAALMGLGGLLMARRRR